MILLNRNKGPQGSFAGTPKENSVGDIQEKHTNTCFDGSLGVHLPHGFGSMVRTPNLGEQFWKD